MQKYRDLMFAIFMLLIVALIQVIIFLANPYYWPSAKALWSQLHFWQRSLIILATIALICLIWWVIRKSFRVIGRMDKAKDEQRIAEMKKAFIQALKETGLAKEVNSEQESGNKPNNGGKPKRRKRKSAKRG